MILANQLRLGNLFIEENSGKIISVIGLEGNRIVFDGMFLDKWQAKPIELNEGWLKKLGFIKNKFDHYFEIENCQIEIYSFGNEVIVCIDSVVNKNIKYVHQLQNLYFALTNKELSYE